MADRLPTSTYRLQLHAGFGFAHAAAVVPYLSQLGVSHLYLSPILQAVPGSMHGYDVVDHSRVSADLGGETGLVDLAETAHRHGLGIVVDVVPNHMAIPGPEHLNPQLWDLLLRGRESSTAHWFDVDWDHGEGRLSLPILGSPLAEMLTSGELELGEHAGVDVLGYGDHALPLAPGTRSDDVGATLAAQHYALSYWRDKDQVLNYRRFFDVDTLIAVRVELDDVFDATHATLLDLHRRGVIEGFRIDHPDGLADPQGYLERLRERTDGAWVVVEKILEPGEQLPVAWPTAGTTGYDAIRALQAALVPAVGAELADRWRAVGGEPSYERAELASKRQVIDSLFQSEVGRLARAAVAAAAVAGASLTAAEAGETLTEMLAHVEVYRAYLRPGQPAEPKAVEQLAHLADQTRAVRPDLAGATEVLHRLLSDTASDDPATRDLVVRFQQVCGPVMAKGVEDTTYYRWNRMVGLNEVGGDPRSLDSPDVATLHAWAEQQAAHHPGGLTGLSTHDTKRSEDVRARLLAAADDLAGWDEVAEAIRRGAAQRDVDAPTAYLLAQTLLGVWPIDGDRLGDYLRKAIREAKVHTSWNDPDEAYEQRVAELAQACLSGPVAAALDRVVEALRPLTRSTTLAGKLLQLTLPGIPDVYQGTELASTRALVDPDNRRPVDYERRQALLDSLDSRDSKGSLGSKGTGMDDGGRDDATSVLDAEKLRVVARTLRLRRDRPDLFDAQAEYVPLRTGTPHLIGFLRGGRAATLVTRWPGSLARDGWADAVVDLPPGEWTDVLSDAHHRVGDARLRCSELLAALPVALLVKEDG